MCLLPFWNWILKCWNFFPSLTLISRNVCKTRRQVLDTRATISNCWCSDAETATNSRQDLRAGWVEFSEDKWQSLFFLLSPPNEIPPTAAPVGPEKNQAQRQEIKSMKKPPQIMIMNSWNINVHSYYWSVVTANRRQDKTGTDPTVMKDSLMDHSLYWNNLLGAWASLALSFHLSRMKMSAWICAP